MEVLSCSPAAESSEYGLRGRKFTVEHATVVDELPYIAFARKEPRTIHALAAEVDHAMTAIEAALEDFVCAEVPDDAGLW